MSNGLLLILVKSQDEAIVKDAIPIKADLSDPFDGRTFNPDKPLEFINYLDQKCGLGNYELKNWLC